MRAGHPLPGRMAKDMMKVMRICPECDKSVKGTGKSVPSAGTERPRGRLLRRIRGETPLQGNQGGPAAHEGLEGPLRVYGQDPAVTVWSFGGRDLELTSSRRNASSSNPDSRTTPMGRRPSWRNNTLHSGKTASAPGEHPQRPSTVQDGRQCLLPLRHGAQLRGVIESTGMCFRIDCVPRGDFDCVRSEPKREDRGLFGKLFTIANRASPDLADYTT